MEPFWGRDVLSEPYEYDGFPEHLAAVLSSVSKLEMFLHDGSGVDQMFDQHFRLKDLRIVANDSRRPLNLTILQCLPVLTRLSLQFEPGTVFNCDVLCIGIQSLKRLTVFQLAVEDVPTSDLVAIVSALQGAPLVHLALQLPADLANSWGNGLSQQLAHLVGTTPTIQHVALYGRSEWGGPLERALEDLPMLKTCCCGMLGRQTAWGAVRIVQKHVATIEHLELTLDSCQFAISNEFHETLAKLERLKVLAIDMENSPTHVPMASMFASFPSSIVHLALVCHLHARDLSALGDALCRIHSLQTLHLVSLSVDDTKVGCDFFEALAELPELHELVMDRVTPIDPCITFPNSLRSIQWGVDKLDGDAITDAILPIARYLRFCSLRYIRIAPTGLARLFHTIEQAQLLLYLDLQFCSLPKPLWELLDAEAIRLPPSLRQVGLPQLLPWKHDLPNLRMLLSDVPADFTDEFNEYLHDHPLVSRSPFLPDQYNVEEHFAIFHKNEAYTRWATWGIGLTFMGEGGWMMWK